MSNYDDEIENEGLEECSKCCNFFDPEEMTELNSGSFCSECLPTEQLVENMKTLGYEEILVEYCDCYNGVYLAPISLNKPTTIKPSKLGVSASELMELLWEHEVQLPPEFQDMFELRYKRYKL